MLSTKQESKKGSSNLKLITVNPQSLSMNGGTGGRRSRRRSRGLIALGPAGDLQKTTQRMTKGIGGSSGMKKSEIMRKIRQGLFEKRQKAIADSNVSLKESTSKGSGVGRNASTPRGRTMLPPTSRASQKHMRDSQVSLDSKSSAEKAIEFFELKKKERSLNSVSNDNDSTQTLGKMIKKTNLTPLSLVSESSADTISSKSNSSFDNQINIDLPDDLRSKQFVLPKTSQSKIIRSILKKSSKYPVNQSSVSLSDKNSNSPFTSSSDSMENIRLKISDKDSDSREETHAYGEEFDNTKNQDIRQDDFKAEITPPVPNYDFEEVVGKERDVDEDLYINKGGDRSRRRKRLRRDRMERARTRSQLQTSRVNRKKTYKLGKKGNKISVMLYGRQTRKNLGDKHRSVSGGDINKIRRVLRHRCLMKTGSTAPPRLIREIYKNTRLFGDIISKRNANEANDYLNLREGNFDDKDLL